MEIFLWIVGLIVGYLVITLAIFLFLNHSDKKFRSSNWFNVNIQLSLIWFPILIFLIYVGIYSYLTKKSD